MSSNTGNTSNTNKPGCGCLTSKGCLIALLIFVGLGVIGTISDMISPNPSTTSTTPAVEAPQMPGQSEIWVAAQGFARDRLKAPRTAKFPYSMDISITDNGNGNYTVNGYVDSENSFGAMLRTDFECKMFYNTSDESFYLTGFEFYPR